MDDLCGQSRSDVDRFSLLVTLLCFSYDDHHHHYGSLFTHCVCVYEKRGREGDPSGEKEFWHPSWGNMGAPGAAYHDSNGEGTPIYRLLPFVYMNEVT